MPSRVFPSSLTDATPILHRTLIVFHTQSVSLCVPHLWCELVHHPFVQVELARILLAEGQGHLFEHWPPPLNADADKHRFFKQVGTSSSELP